MKENFVDISVVYDDVEKVVLIGYSIYGSNVDNIEVKIEKDLFYKKFMNFLDDLIEESVKV